MRIISIVGRKDAGKTTLVVALARELRRQHKRVMTIKHATHDVDVDRENSDSFRHFSEGGADRTLVASPKLRVLFDRHPDDTDPITLARTYMADADIVLVEGFKSAPIPKIEVYRRSVGGGPIVDDPGVDTALWKVLVTDDPATRAACRVLRFTDTMWLHVLSMHAWEEALEVTT